ncbi:MAG: exodeoxyribonuclease VII small subunit [Clostridia bacterium]|nr:exodeoxyribonuclease VII small subunit [Clostridia bacterium]
MKFEEALEKLNKIKEELENPEITLDKSLELYKESVEYTKICLDTLKDADGKILVIKNEIDKLVEKPLDISGV